MKRLLLLAALVTLAGCSTAPKNAQPFSEEQLERPDERSAILVVYRDFVPPLAYDVRVDLDGERVAQLPNEAFTVLRIAPGMHVVELSWPFIAATRGDSVEFSADANRYYFLNVNGGIDDVILTPVGTTMTMSANASFASYEGAVAQLRACCRFVPSARGDQLRSRP